MLKITFENEEYKIKTSCELSSDADMDSISYAIKGMLVTLTYPTMLIDEYINLD